MKLKKETFREILGKQNRKYIYMKKNEMKFDGHTNTHIRL